MIHTFLFSPSGTTRKYAVAMLVIHLAADSKISYNKRLA